MLREWLHRFEHGGKRFAIDPETCFCFECDAISWDVLAYYPETPVNRILHELEDRHDRKELAEVVSELEWLRATKSILIPVKREDVFKMYEVNRGVHRLTLTLPDETPARESARRAWFGRGDRDRPGLAASFVDDALALLIGRAEAQKDLRLEVYEEAQVRNPEHIADLGAFAYRRAALAGKTLTLAVYVAGLEIASPPPELAGHTVSVCIEFPAPDAIAPALRDLGKALDGSLSRLAKAVQSLDSGVIGRIVVLPNHPRFGTVVEALDQAGFNFIELDLDGAYVAHPKLNPQEMIEGLSQSAVYYVQRLLNHHYFRLDPIASLFQRIYNGSPLRRSDPAGANELAVDASGAVYPCRNMMGIEAFRLGTVSDQTLDEAKLRVFDDVGSLTTAACLPCWVRNLCGGGCAAVHQALTGSFRTPHDPWCEAQRAWMAAAVSAFQALSSQGVQFDRVYKVLGRTETPSLFTLVRAKLTMTLGVRPVQEADAALLTQWEYWNEAAYFLCTETGMLLATKYDREMDALHPRGLEQELVLLRKNGDPCGLFKIRPDRIPGLALAWLYLRDPADYGSDSVRKGFRAILKEAGGQQTIRKMLVPVTHQESGLAEFLQAVGFERAGVLREALYLHGAYHDVALFSFSTD